MSDYNLLFREGTPFSVRRVIVTLLICEMADWISTICDGCYPVMINSFCRIK